MRGAGLLCLASCSQVLGLEPPQHIDASSDGPLLPTCVDRWRTTNLSFDAVQPLGGVNTPDRSERHPYVVPIDATTYELYFTRDGDYYVARGTAVMFESATPSNTLNTPQVETKLSVAANRMRGFFSSNRYGNFDLFRAYRDDTQKTWSYDQMYVAALNDTSPQQEPHASPDMLRLYYSVTPTGAMAPELAIAQRTSTTQSFVFDRSLDELTLAGDAFDPTLTHDELLIVFVSSRSGNRDLWFATRTTRDAPFDAPQRLSALSSNVTDELPHVTADGCRVYFVSSRGGSTDLFTAQVL